MRSIKTAILSAATATAILATASTATAQDATASASGHPAHDLAGVAIGPHVGALVPQLFSDLGAFPIVGLELGYVLPFDAGSMIRPLQLTFDTMFTAPSASGTEDAPAFGEEGETFDWELTERYLIFELSALWRFIPPADGFSAYGHIGPRLYLMESVMNAESSSGNDLLENRETKTEVGLVVGGGAEYHVGPGAVFGALEFGWSDIKQRITGDSNNGALVVDVGYRFMF